MANECIPYFKPGDDFTGQCTAAVTGKRFVMLDAAAAAWAPEGLRSTGAPNVPPVKQCTAAARALGVAQRDQATVNGLVGIFSGNVVVPVTAGAAVVRGVEVESDSTGRAITYSAGIKLGIALNAASAAGDTIAVKINL